MPPNIPWHWSPTFGNGLGENERVSMKDAFNLQQKAAVGSSVPLQGWLVRRLSRKPSSLQSDTSALSIFGAGTFFVMGCPVYYHQDVLNVGAVFLPPTSIALPV